MKIQYVAEDGTAFETEKECRIHEQAISFGADVIFVNAVSAALAPLILTSDRGYGVIEFDDDEDQIKVAIAIAKNFEKLYEAYERIDADRRVPKKVSTKRTLVNTKAKKQ